MLSVLARISLAAGSVYLIFFKHKLRSSISMVGFKKYLKPMMVVAGPAIFANVATPIGNTYAIYVLAEFGDAAIAGNTIVARILPIAFAILISLSTAIGPIIGQNLGAKNLTRVKETVTAALKLTAAYVLILWPLFYFGQNALISVFNASPEAAIMIETFALWIVPLMFFLGALNISTAAFNNLGHPITATLFNVGKTTIGTIPFVYFGSQYLGAEGVLIGQAIGGAIFGLLSIIACIWIINKIIASSDYNIQSDETLGSSKAPLMPYSSARTFNCPTHELTEGKSK